MTTKPKDDKPPVSGVKVIGWGAVVGAIVTAVAVFTNLSKASAQFKAEKDAETKAIQAETLRRNHVENAIRIGVDERSSQNERIGRNEEELVLQDAEMDEQKLRAEGRKGETKLQDEKIKAIEKNDTKQDDRYAKDKAKELAEYRDRAKAKDDE